MSFVLVALYNTIPTTICTINSIFVSYKPMELRVFIVILCMYAELRDASDLLCSICSPEILDERICHVGTYDE